MRTNEENHVFITCQNTLCCKLRTKTNSYTLSGCYLHLVVQIFIVQVFLGGKSKGFADNLMSELVVGVVCLVRGGVKLITLL